MSLSKFVLGDAHGPLRRWCPESDRVRTSLDAIALRFSLNPQRDSGGRGRIRTFVARKERQIYSLLVLATHPPVPKKHFGTRTTSPAPNPSITCKRPAQKHKKDSCQETPARSFLTAGFAPPRSPTKFSGGAG